MYRFLNFTIVLLLFCNAYLGQTTSDGNNETISEIPKNNIQLEFLGKGLYYSFSYERELINLESITFNIGIGGSIFPGLTSVSPSNEILFPIYANIGYHINSHSIHIGYGTTFWRYYTNYLPIDQGNINQQPIAATLKKQWEWFSHISLEYRYHPPRKKYFFKAGYVPLFFAEIPQSAFTRKINYQTSFCLGFGYKF